MARVTVEDCLKNVKNRFELVIIAAKRARQLMRGKTPHVEWDNDKPTVVALREIAKGFVNVPEPEHVEEPHAAAPVVEIIEIEEIEIELEEDVTPEEKSETTTTQPPERHTDE